MSEGGAFERADGSRWPTHQTTPASSGEEDDGGQQPGAPAALAPPAGELGDDVPTEDEEHDPHACAEYEHDEKQAREHVQHLVGRAAGTAAPERSVPGGSDGDGSEQDEQDRQRERRPLSPAARGANVHR